MAGVEGALAVTRELGGGGNGPPPGAAATPAPAGRGARPAAFPLQDEPAARGDGAPFGTCAAVARTANPTEPKTGRRALCEVDANSWRPQPSPASRGGPTLCATPSKSGARVHFGASGAGDLFDHELEAIKLAVEEERLRAASVARGEAATEQARAGAQAAERRQEELARFEERVSRRVQLERATERAELRVETANWRVACRALYAWGAVAAARRPRCELALACARRRRTALALRAWREAAAALAGARRMHVAAGHRVARRARLLAHRALRGWMGAAARGVEMTRLAGVATRAARAAAEARHRRLAWLSWRAQVAGGLRRAVRLADARGRALARARRARCWACWRAAARSAAADAMERRALRRASERRERLAASMRRRGEGRRLRGCLTAWRLAVAHAGSGRCAVRDALQAAVLAQVLRPGQALQTLRLAETASALDVAARAATQGSEERDCLGLPAEPSPLRPPLDPRPPPTTLEILPPPAAARIAEARAAGRALEASVAALTRAEQEVVKCRLALEEVVWSAPGSSDGAAATAADGGRLHEGRVVAARSRQRAAGAALRRAVAAHAAADAAARAAMDSLRADEALCRGLVRARFEAGGDAARLRLFDAAARVHDTERGTRPLFEQLLRPMVAIALDTHAGAAPAALNFGRGATALEGIAVARSVPARALRVPAGRRCLGRWRRAAARCVAARRAAARSVRLLAAARAAPVIDRAFGAWARSTWARSARLATCEARFARARLDARALAVRVSRWRAHAVGVRADAATLDKELADERAARWRTVMEDSAGVVIEHRESERALAAAVEHIAQQQVRLQQFAGVGVMLARRQERTAARRALCMWQAVAVGAVRDRQALQAAAQISRLESALAKASSELQSESAAARALMISVDRMNEVRVRRAHE